MKPSDLLAHRLTAQRLIGPLFSSVKDVVRAFGAVQAQDYHGAKWGVGQRCGMDDAALDEAFNAGLILRTHVLRPTWHFVAPEDIGWMLKLSSPRVHRANAFMYRKLGLDDRTMKRGDAVLVRALEKGGHLERTDLAHALERAKLPIHGDRLAYFLMHAELEGHICSGPRRGRQFTYALLQERVPGVRRLERDEALAELVRRYFTSRGPASLHDLCWWSGLTMADGRSGVRMIAKELSTVSLNGRDLWYAKDREALKVPANLAHLLPNYDEYGIAYKDRSAIYDPEQARRSGSRGDPVFRHLVLINGRVAGTWESQRSARSIAVTTSCFRPLKSKEHAAVVERTRDLAAFLRVQLK